MLDPSLLVDQANHGVFDQEVPDHLLEGSIAPLAVGLDLSGLEQPKTARAIASSLANILSG
jgi:hypothetical protein